MHTYQKWIQLQEGILNESTKDKKKNAVFFYTRDNFRGMFQSSLLIYFNFFQKETAFIGSKEILNSDNNGNFQELFDLVGFYGISTFVGYLMQNPFLNK